MDDIKKRLENELEGKIPELRLDVLGEEIPQNKTRNTEKPKIVNMKALISSVSAIAAVILLCVGLIPLLGGGDPEPTSQALITVQINPRVIMITDGDGIVTNVIATNEDADIILSTESFNEAVIGKSFKESIVAYADIATRLGYIDPDDTANAVKITTTDDEVAKEAIRDARDSLESYFCQKGIFALVVEAEATVDEICEINELNIEEEISSLINTLKDLSPMYAKRENQKLTPEEIIEEYKNKHVSEEIKKEIKDAINEIILIKEINRLSLEIILHEENPIPILGNYWMLKEMDTDCPESLAGLISEMDNLILEYEEKYGVKIESIIQLTEIHSVYKNINMDGVDRELDDNELFENPNKYIDIMKEIGRDVSQFEGIFEIPDTIKELEVKQEEALKNEMSKREEINKEEYEKQREEISKESYEEYKKQMESFFDDIFGKKKK